MNSISSTNLFEPQTVKTGSQKVFFFLTKFALISTSLALFVTDQIRFSDLFDPFWFFYTRGLSTLAFFGAALAAVWVPWAFLWSFGLGMILNVRSAQKILNSMEPAWTDGFKRHTSVTDRVSISGYFEDGKVLVDGLAYKDKVLHVMTRGKVFRIPYSQVRKWEWKIQTPETVEIYGSGLQAASAQASANQSNVSAAVRAFMQSGFFIQIADENNPVLQFHSSDEAVLRRWHEIFNQINEGNI